MKTTAISQACEVVRGGSTENDSVLYCPEDKPLVFSCNAIDNQAPDNGPTNMSSQCPSSGHCHMNPGRTDLGGDGFYLETVTNGSSQGCLAYDDNHNHTAYRIEITCCESIE